MPTPLQTMYLLSGLTGILAYAVSRGPDGRLLGCVIGFAVIAIVYVSLAWVTRHQPIWPHLAAHLVLFCAASALGMLPKPHLDEMAGMMYVFVPAIILAMLGLASAARLLARWF